MKDDPHSGRKVTVSTHKRIAAIEEYVMKDRRITVRQVGENFDIGYGTARYSDKCTWNAKVFFCTLGA